MSNSVTVLPSFNDLTFPNLKNKLFLGHRHKNLGGSKHKNVPPHIELETNSARAFECGVIQITWSFLRTVVSIKGRSKNGKSYSPMKLIMETLK